jgi:hypothetical protein
MSFSRTELAFIIKDVRKFDAHIHVSEAWVHKAGNQWEFHFWHVRERSCGTAAADKFYWHGRADNAYDARAKGWTAFLQSKGVDGYTREEAAHA